MGCVSSRIVGLALLALGSSAASASYTYATYTVGTNTVGVTLYAPTNTTKISPPSGSLECTYSGSTGCGYGEVLAGATDPDWHAGRGSYSSDTAFLNSLDTHVNYSLGTGAALYAYDPSAPSPSKPWRSPSSDWGHILSTDDGTTSSTGIQITAQKVSNTQYYFSEVSFYWGSVDPWNTVILTDSAGKAVYISGIDLHSQGVCVPAYSTSGCISAYDNTDVVVDFNAGGNAWRSIQLVSCEATATNGTLTTPCNPAFEIDNLEYTTTTAAGPFGGLGEGNNSPTPEPTSLLLMGTGVVAIAKSLRRYVRP